MAPPAAASKPRAIPGTRGSVILLLFTTLIPRPLESAHDGAQRPAPSLTRVQHLFLPHRWGAGNCKCTCKASSAESGAGEGVGGCSYALLCTGLRGPDV